MDLVQSKWDIEECRYEDGIFYSDDTFVLLTGSPCQGYQASIRQPIQALTEANPEGWTNVDPVCSAEYGSLLIIGGGGSYEGDGFLAVVDATTRRLVWLLHLFGAEPFTEVHVDNSILRAVSQEYPFRFAWTISIECPHLLFVKTIKDW